MSEIHDILKSSIKLSKDIGHVNFRDLVYASTNYEVIKLNPTQNETDKALFDQIMRSANDLIKYSQKTRQRFQANRINDIGRAIEEVFVQELRKTKLVPELLSESGYPDMKIIDNSNRITYLESKAVSTGWDSSFRSFYYLDGKKIKAHARHLLIAWDLVEETSKYWQIKGWKLCDLYDLTVKTKLEFNTSNKEIYKKELIIAQM